MLYLKEMRDHISANSVWIFGALEIFIPFYILLSAHTHKWIGSYTHGIVFMYFFIICFALMNLSAVMTLRRKESAKNKPVELLNDVDVEYEFRIKYEFIRDLDASLKERCRNWLGNFFKFCEGNFAYKVIAVVGAFFITSAFIMFIINLLKGEYSREKFYSTLALEIAGAAFLITVLMLSNTPEMYLRQLYFYQPFDDKVNVPKKVLFSKILTAYLTGGFIHIIKLPLGIFFFITGFDLLRNTTEVSKEVIPLLNSRLSEARIINVFDGIGLFVACFGIYLAYRAVKLSYKKAKKSLLVIMEKNWKRNLQAVKYILPDVMASSLEELLQLLKEKQRRPIPEDVNALIYISSPLWKPKRGFFAPYKKKKDAREIIQ